MINFKKLLSLKAIPLSLIILFLFNSHVYPYSISKETLRVPSSFEKEGSGQENQGVLSSNATTRRVFLGRAVAAVAAIVISTPMVLTPPTLMAIPTTGAPTRLIQEQDNIQADKQAELIEQFFRSEEWNNLVTGKNNTGFVAARNNVIEKARRGVDAEFASAIERLINFLCKRYNKAEVDKDLVLLNEEYFLPRKICIGFNLFTPDQTTMQWYPEIIVFRVKDKEYLLDSQKGIVVYGDPIGESDSHIGVIGMTLHGISFIFLTNIENSVDRILQLCLNKKPGKIADSDLRAFTESFSKIFNKHKDVFQTRDLFIEKIIRYAREHELVHLQPDRDSISLLLGERFGVPENIWVGMPSDKRRYVAEEADALMNWLNKENEPFEILLFFIAAYWSLPEDTAAYLAFRYALNTCAGIPQSKWISSSKQNISEAVRLFDLLYYRHSSSSEIDNNLETRTNSSEIDNNLETRTNI